MSGFLMKLIHLEIAKSVADTPQTVARRPQSCRNKKKSRQHFRFGMAEEIVRKGGYPGGFGHRDIFLGGWLIAPGGKNR
ncbi:hypothetical protein ACFFTM_06960 [Pseudoduganella plicata]|uniref:hypothetical protein n=1 Tax=Pseudoduganella plicata TaxID=321984 RepID=UPI001E5C3000|nr:hypothetical protein [Pseudoduganella plicata]